MKSEVISSSPPTLISKIDQPKLTVLRLGIFNNLFKLTWLIPRIPFLYLHSHAISLNFGSTIIQNEKKAAWLNLTCKYIHFLR